MLPLLIVIKPKQIRVTIIDSIKSQRSAKKLHYAILLWEYNKSLEEAKSILVRIPIGDK